MISRHRELILLATEPDWAAQRAAWRGLGGESEPRPCGSPAGTLGRDTVAAKDTTRRGAGAPRLLTASRTG